MHLSLRMTHSLDGAWNATALPSTKLPFFVFIPPILSSHTNHSACILPPPPPSHHSCRDLPCPTTAQLLTSLQLSLELRAASCLSDPTLRALFLLNNAAYMHR